MQLFNTSVYITKYLKCLQVDHEMNVDFPICFERKRKVGQRGDGKMKDRS